MRVANYLSIVALTALSAALSAQESDKPLKLLKVQEIQIQTGGYIERSLPGSVEDFKKLAPDSELLKNDLTGYNQDWYTQYYSNPLFSILVGFQFNDRQKKNPGQIRFCALASVIIRDIRLKILFQRKLPVFTTP
jgi:hypothetical protein